MPLNFVPLNFVPLDLPRPLTDGLRAGAAAGLLSGLPSTLHALATGGDVLEASRAAGTLLLPETSSDRALLAGAALAHGLLSLGWATVLSVALPRRHTIAWGAAAGLGIAALDLGLIGRRWPRIRDLAAGPQVADHVVFGAAVGAVLRRATPAG